MVSKPTDIPARLAFVMKACGYTRDVDFTDALGLRAQNLRNWRDRKKIGLASLERIRHVTGASIDWLTSGVGEPFPDGPILYVGAPGSSPGSADRIAKLERDLETLAAVVGKLISVAGRVAPEELPRIAAALQHVRDGEPKPPLFLDLLLETALQKPPPQADGASVRPRKR